MIIEVRKTPPARKFYTAIVCVLSAGVLGCNPQPLPGPDKQGSGTIVGALTGAGGGAVIGAQVSAGAGPGAAVGAGFGAIYGAIKGAGIDLLEEEDIKQMEELERLKIAAWTQEILSDHYNQRLKLHPGRDIYPADLFFEGDKRELSLKTKLLTREIASRLKNDMPWSRIEITSYVTAAGGESDYAEKLNQKRAEQIAIQFVRAGVEARRISIQGITLQAPLVIDPNDKPARYRQAIEFTPLDY